MFAGYYGRSDLTREVLINVNGEECYATGDFARLDVRTGQLIFVGRRDFQIKLRGQRIELGQIEQTVMKQFSSISGCIVVKYMHHDQEHLLAYIETLSDRVTETELREQCLSCLPSYMVPSMFVILERFPLSANGKIDRNVLPLPRSISFDEPNNEDSPPFTQMEERVHELWCKVLHLERISCKISFFAAHGTSLSFMKLYNLYQIEFGIAPDIVACLRKASVAEHAQLLSEVMSSQTDQHYESWASLQLDQGKLIGRLHFHNLLSL